MIEFLSTLPDWAYILSYIVIGIITLFVVVVLDESTTDTPTPLCAGMIWPLVMFVFIVYITYTYFIKGIIAFKKRGQY